MIRLSTLFWILLVAASGSAMFAVKYRVQAIEHALLRTEQQTVATRHQLRVLDAEWAYLNRPTTLAQLNARFLSLVPITTKELRPSLADLPMRPPATPDTLVAAQTPPPAQTARPVVTAMLERSATADTGRFGSARARLAVERTAAPALKRLVAADAAPRSLDALFARIAAQR